MTRTVDIDDVAWYAATDTYRVTSWTCSGRRAAWGPSRREEASIVLDDPHGHGQRPVRLCLMGAPGDTGNLGVTALLHGTLTALAPHLPRADITVFDNGFGVRHAQLTTPERAIDYRLVGLRVSRRYHRPESLANIRVSARLGGLGNPGARALTASDAVLDLTGGDSFSDLYSRLQQRIAFEPKRLVLAAGRPLVLLPQTYGPFAQPTTRRTAVDILRRAHAAWARDHDSYLALQALLGPDFNPERHREGVDVAFRLPSTPPGEALLGRLRGWLRAGRPVIGLNISGLLHQRSPSTVASGLAASYRDLVRALLRRLLDETEANVLLVPHVLGQGATSDEVANAEVVATVAPQQRHRVLAAPPLATPGEVKWLIGQLDWFCGTRLHATIAALSSGVPAAALAYSPKTRGVFASCGLAHEVADLRELDARAAITQLVGSWHRRHAVADQLARHLPTTLAGADRQARAIAETAQRHATARPRTSRGATAA